MSRRYLAGQLGPAAARRVARVVPPQALIETGSLAVGATGEKPPAESRCLLDGHVTSLERIAAAAGLSAAAPAETLLARAYERLGEGVVPLLRGEFVLVLMRPESALVVRDPLGGRAVFVRVLGRTVTFASEVRDLLAMLDTRPPPDPVAVAHWLGRTGTLPHATLHEGIEKLPAGHLLRLGPGGAKRERWWSPRPTTGDDVGTLMRAAVDRALDGAASPGLMLSGGFDSGSIAVLAGRRVRAYSGVFPGAPEIDESAKIAAVREHAGIDGAQVEVRGGSALLASLTFLKAWRMPSVSPNYFAWVPLLARARADGVDVLLDGEGGDEVLGCAPYLIADRLARGRILAAVRLARALPGMGGHPRPIWVRRALLKYGVRGVIPYRIHAALRRGRGRSVPSWLRTEAARALRETDDLWRWKRAGGPRWRAALESQLVDGPDALGVPEQLAREADLAGLVFRHPYRDEALVEHALSAPPELSFDPDLDRPLARSAMRGLLPDEVRCSEHKVVFNRLLESAFEDVDRDAVDGLLGEGAEVGAYADVRAAREARGLGWALDLWRLVTLECWLRTQADAGFPSHMIESLKDSKVGVSAPS